MALLREFCGYLLGVALVLIALALCGLAWIGMEAEFGWQLALAAVVAGAVVRVNAALPLGLFLYASHAWNWELTAAVVFSLPGLLLVLPSTAIALFSAIIGSPITRH